MTATNTSIDNKTYQQILKDLYPWKTENTAELKNSPVSEELISFLNHLFEFETNTDFTQYVSKELNTSTYIELKEQYLTLVDIAKFLDRIFQIAIADKKATAPLSKIINHLKPAIFKIAIFDYRLFANPNHAGNLYLNKLTRLNSSLSKDSPLVSEIAPMVEQLSDKLLKKNESSEIRESIESSFKRLDTFVSSIEKKAKIFEKRNQEIAEGKSRANHAKQWVDEQTDIIIQNASLPMFVSTFIEQSWKHVLFLERLRSDNSENMEGVTLLKFLVLCFHSVDNTHELEKLSELHHHVSENLVDNIEKTNLSVNEASGFLRGLNLSFGAVIKQSEDAIYEKNKDQIIRLKPKSHLALNFEETESEEPDFESMSSLEWAEYKLTQQTNINSEDNDNEENIDEQSTPNDISNWTVGEWFDIKIKNKTTRAKLVSLIKPTGHFIFTNYQGAKVLECNQEEIKQKLMDDSIIRIKLRPNIEDALKKTFIKTQNEQLEKLEEEKRKREQIRLKKLEAQEKAEKEQEELMRKEEKRRLLVKEAKEQINTLSVGSWIELKQHGKVQKCKLAARISTSNKYIFTDRSGIKIIEPTLDELAALLVDNKVSLTLKNDLFNLTLASVISERRKSNK